MNKGSKWTMQELQRLENAGLTVNLGVLDCRPPVRFVIGIDPGKHTGFAVYDRQQKMLTEVTSVLIHQAFDQVKKYAVSNNVLVRVEDARQRKYFGNTGREVLQGAGAAKRDATIWEDFLTENGVSFELVSPINNKTKLKAENFRTLTGWGYRTNEHARDAAMLCWRW